MTTLLFSDRDRWRLGRLVSSDAARGIATWQLLDDLEWQLEEAKTLPASTVPDGVVTMNSTVRLVNVNSKSEIVCTIVYPECVELVDGGVSVLEPLGTRLIGCEVGDLIEYENRNECRTWRIAELVFQPERVGEFDL